MLLGKRPRTREPSFLRALMATFASSFLLSICLKLIQDLLSFVNPQLLRSLHAACHTAFLRAGGRPAGLSTPCRETRTQGAIPTFLCDL